MSTVVFLLGLILFLAYVFLAVFDRTKVPDVLLLIVVGIVLGPYVSGLAEPSEFGKVGPVMSTVALVVVLLLGGIELDIAALRTAARPTLYLTLSSFALTAAVVAVIGRFWLGLDWLMASTLGTILGGTSSAIVVPLIRGLRLPEYPATVLTLESALTDVLTVVLATSLMETAASHGAVLRPAALVGSILTSMLMAAVLGAIGGVFWLAALRLKAKSPDAVIATLAFAFLVYGAAEALHSNGGIAVLAFGLTLGNRSRMGLNQIPFSRNTAFGQLGRREHAANRQAQFLLKVFFFVYLGISMPFRNLPLAMIAFVAVLVVYAARHALVRLSVDRSRLTWDDAAAMCALAPKGLAAAVLAGQPRLLGLPRGDTVEDLSFMVVLISISMTAVMIPATRIPLVQSLVCRVLGFPRGRPRQNPA